MTVGFQPHSLGSPLVSPCLTACGPSRRPPATSAWHNIAINTKKRAENKQKCQNSVLCETGTHSSKTPLPSLETMVKGSDLTLLTTHRLRLASHRFLHRFRSKIVQNLEPMAKLSLSWISPSQNLAKPLVYTPETFRH